MRIVNLLLCRTLCGASLFIVIIELELDELPAAELLPGRR